MTDVIIDAGTLTASREDRMVTGLLVPYGEECRSNLGRFTFEAGTVQIPVDVPNTLSFNVEHERESVIGRGVSAMETPAGIVATFRIADGPAGDAALADIAAGKRTHLSAEVSNVKIKDGKGVSGYLFAAALVEKPAFPSATLLAAAVDTPEDAPAESEPAPAEFTPDENGDIAIAATATPTSVTVTAGEDVSVFVNETNTTEQEKLNMANASVDNTLTANATVEQTATLADLIHGLSEVHKTGDATLLAALSDVKANGTGAVGTNIGQSQYLGELWSGRDVARKIVPLLNHGDLTSLQVQGWRWTTEPAVDLWAGNKSAVPSNSPATEAYTLTAQRIAGAHDVAREFRDFSNEEFWNAYFKAMTNSYAKVSDAYVFAQIVAAATPVTAGAVPSGANPGFALLIDGALKVIDNGGLPSFAIVAPDVYRNLVLLSDDNKLAFLNASLGLEEGTIDSFKVVPDSRVAAGKAIVGDRNAAAVFELPGSPIRVEGLDMVKGGIDPGLFGYVAVPVHSASNIVLVSPAA